MAKALTGIVTSGKLYLEKWDEEKDTYVVFQRPSRREAEMLAAMRAKAELVWNTEEQGTVRQRDGVPLMTQESEMVAMCLVECNLPDEDDKLVFVPGTSCRVQGKPLTGAQKTRFYKNWGDLPDELATEITDKLREFHPPFNFRSSEEGEE